MISEALLDDRHTVVRAPERGARLLMYASDASGLGHLRRSLAIAGHLARAIPDLKTLLVSGPPAVHHFTLPPGVDYVKLPSVINTGENQYRGRDLDLPPGVSQGCAPPSSGRFPCNSRPMSCSSRIADLLSSHPRLRQRASA